MLNISIPGGDYFDEEKQIFIKIHSVEIELEHSLIAISKWESKHHKVFLSKDEKTSEEILDYIRCMTITKNVDPNAYFRLTPSLIKTIVEYIEDPTSACKFKKDENEKTCNEPMTSEFIYYCMAAAQMPIEYENWHINRLMNVLKIFGKKNAPKKKYTKAEQIERYRQMNEINKAKFAAMKDQ